ncbi:DUF4386 domain-containing protein [Blastococcus sp. PRF04-17]|uniref:DUF4386 domain-containing protein n=1 Tax=Blastococcus sp. PRF04-17 TaxID=2933797 RepID=UPI001FF23322|nr:DUF4386 domain-containing protein [Blastococcus sp. PRF04-17]UOY03374.1 DUF4386 domain-containing protein [Blastococcus sp. PRF04-17]
MTRQRSHRATAIPRILPALGLIGAPLPLASDIAMFFGVHDRVSPAAALATIPVAGWESSLGVYLVVTGFRPATVAALPHARGVPVTCAPACAASCTAAVPRAPSAAPPTSRRSRESRGDRTVKVRGRPGDEVPRGGTTVAMPSHAQAAHVTVNSPRMLGCGSHMYR